MEIRLEQNKNVHVIDKNNIKYIQFNNLRKYDHLLTHGFTTRLGGVSQGECSSLNLGFNRRDTMENVRENYRRIAHCMHIPLDHMVFSKQVHGNKIKKVTYEDCHKGMDGTQSIEGFDGLITNEAGIALVTFYADCVPVLFFDPVKKAIASVHSGWRGTVQEIAGEAVRKLKESYGSEPSDLEVAIGPSIRQCCFEVDEDVYSDFVSSIPYSRDYCIKKANGKWHIGLQEIIIRTLLNHGINPEKICYSGICTMCNKDIFFSYRGEKGKTGTMAAIMEIKTTN